MPLASPDYPLPIDQAPLFVGGKGILVERADDRESVEAVVYPVSPPNTRFVFTHPDGVSISVIENRSDGWDGDDFLVKDITAGTEGTISASGPCGSIRFALTPGHDYVVSK